ncbi:MAG: hypothetical protein LAN37_14645 [Acidobacteriia bacterium]|nr:hypothetical protein [Terriglobia bacterium]
MLNKLISINSTRKSIKPRLSLPARYALFTKDIKIKAGEEPGAIWLSVVAFSDDRQHAMVWVSNYCGNLCGSGLLWKLEKNRSVWRVTSKQPVCGFIS